MHSDQEDLHGDGDYTYTTDGDKDNSMESVNSTENRLSDLSYSRIYYAKNKEKMQAYSREYSARVRADPEKKEIINAQKRILMQRRAAEKRQERAASRTMKEESEEDLKRRDHKKYYEKNKERMRNSNRKYYRKLMADPEKRAEINEKKKLAMRRLKERKMMGAQAAGQTVVDQPCEIVIEDQLRSGVEHLDSEELQAMGDYFIQEIEIPVEVETTIVNEELEAVVEEQESQLQEEVLTWPKEDLVETQLDYVETTEIFPFATSAYNAIPEEERGNFVAYIEQCAKEYFQPPATNEIEEIED